VLKIFSGAAMPLLALLFSAFLLPGMPCANAAEPAKASVKLVAVDDARIFVDRPRDPSTPSLQHPEDNANKDELAHTVGRQRHLYGAAGRNISLGKEETVTGLMRATVQKALEAKGYRLVEDGAPQDAAARLLSVSITQFWTWQTPGPFGKSAEFRAIAVLTGDALFGTPSITVEGYASDDTAHVRAGHWHDIMQAGLDELRTKIEAQLKPAS